MKKIFRGLTAWWVGFAALTVTAVTSLSFTLAAVAIIGFGISGLIALGAGLILLFIGPYLLRAFRAMSRSIAASAYDVEISTPVRRLARHDNVFVQWLQQIYYDWKDSSVWRGFAYEASMVLVSWFAVFVAMAGIGVGLGVFAYADPELLGGTNIAPLANLSLATRRLIGAGAVVVGIILIWLLSRAHRALACSLLSATSKQVLHQQVTQLGAARQGAVDAAEAERQRIERDLHDGAQPQLVALAMTLGLAKQALKTDPGAAADLIDEAHAQAKQAITDLRQLARGIHPAVLTDRGLDAALSSVVARSPIPCDLDIQLPQRPTPEIEAAAYFVVAEALTNVAKHSQASHASVQIYPTPGGVTVSVVDNGRGGARVVEQQLGTSGLKGLSDRVAATGGTLRVHSPAGGPTHLSATLPLAPDTVNLEKVTA